MKVTETAVLLYTYDAKCRAATKAFPRSLLVTHLSASRRRLADSVGQVAPRPRAAAAVAAGVEDAVRRRRIAQGRRARRASPTRAAPTVVICLQRGRRSCAI